MGFLVVVWGGCDFEHSYDHYLSSQSGISSHSLSLDAITLGLIIFGVIFVFPVSYVTALGFMHLLLFFISYILSDDVFVMFKWDLDVIELSV